MLCLLRRWLSGRTRIPPIFSHLDEPAGVLPGDPAITLFTGPRDTEGYIDYETALNEHLRRATTPQENAVALFVQAIGHAPFGRAALPPSLFDWLGVSAPTADGHYFRSAAEQFGESAAQQVEQKCRWFTQRPWQESQEPDFAAWIRENAGPLDTAVEASRRPSYFHPLVSKLGERGLLASASYITLPEMFRHIGVMLCLRASLLCGTGQPDEAWEDLFAAMRLARLISHGGTMLEFLVGCALEHIASRCAVGLVAHTLPTAQRCRELCRQYATLPAPGELAPKLAVTERGLALEFHQLVYREGVQELTRVDRQDFVKGPPDERDSLFRQAVIWPALMASIHRFYDQIEDATSRPTFLERKAAWDELAQRWKSVERWGKNFDCDLKTLRNVKTDTDRREYTARYGSWSIAQSTTSVRQTSMAVDRWSQVRANMMLMFALAEHRADTGGDPEELAELCPTHLPSVPGDLFTGRPLVYRRTPKGYLFYSLGPTGRDDGGRGPVDSPAGDNIGVRMPPPQETVIRMPPNFPRK